MRAGFAPWSIDQFADEDLRNTGPCCQASSDPASWLDAFAQSPDAPWIYTGGPENHARILDKLAATRPLWGVAGRALRHVRDPLRLAAVLRQEGWPTLAVIPGHRVPDTGEWLRKPRRSGGGLGISIHHPALAEPAASTQTAASTPNAAARPNTANPFPTQRVSYPPPSRRYYFQRQLPAETPIVGATFLMADGQARLLGIAQQFHGLDIGARSTLPGESSGGDCGPASSGHGIGPATRREMAFAYRGSITVNVEPTVQESLQRLGELLARRFALRGIIGVDVALRDQHCWVLEVNPRYPASAELFEQDDQLPLPEPPAQHPAAVHPAAVHPAAGTAGLARSLVGLHAAVWRGQPVDETLHAAGIEPARLPLGVPGIARGKWIVYARSPVIWPERLQDSPSTTTALDAASGSNRGSRSPVSARGFRDASVQTSNHWLSDKLLQLKGIDDLESHANQARPGSATAFSPQARFADIPASLTRIVPGSPICTLLAYGQQGTTVESFQQLLVGLETRLLDRLSGLVEGRSGNGPSER